MKRMTRATAVKDDFAKQIKRKHKTTKNNEKDSKRQPVKGFCQ